MYGKAVIVPTLPVSDLDRARKWYVDKLGFRVDERGSFPEGVLLEAGDFRFAPLQDRGATRRQHGAFYHGR